MDKRVKQAETLAAISLSDAVNDTSWNGDAFVEQICFRTHRTLQATIFRTVLKLIETMGSDEYDFDDRNAACHEISKQIIDTGILETSCVPYI